MDQKSEYLIQVFEKIGAPILSSITESHDGQDSDAAPDVLAAQAAQKMAELLARSVKISIDLGKNMDLASTQDQGESLRVALTALAGSLVAGQYKQNGHIPEDNDTTKTVASLQAVMTFSENFTPSPEAIQRLKNLEAQGQQVDEQQTNIQFIHAFLPAIHAVANFSFGEPENQLIQTISRQLIDKAKALRIAFFGSSISADDEKLIDLSLIRSLVQIYTSCHELETNKLMTLSEENTAEPSSINAVWDCFELRVSMLSTLAEGFSSGKKNIVQNIPSPPPEPEAAPIIKQPPPPADETQETTPSTPPPPTTESAQANPMAMFSKPKNETLEQAPMVEPSSEPQESVNVPSSPEPLPQAQPDEPESSPPSSPPAQEATKNPMTFFKQPNDKQDKDGET